MPLFRPPKKPGYLGIDIGIGGIKLAEVINEGGRVKLMTYAYSERPLDQQVKPLLDNPKVTADWLIKMIKQSGAVANRAVSSLPQQTVFSSIISVPAVSHQKDLKPLIEAQIRKLTSLPIEEMIIDSKLIDESGKQEEKGEKEKPYIRVLVTGAAKTLVQKYVTIFKLSKINLVALETEAIALIRSLVGRDKSVIMIIDFGAARTNIAIVERGIPLLMRSVSVGGGLLTKAIAEQMGLSIEEAEQIKLDLAKAPSSPMPPVVEALLQPILNEVNYSLGEYQRLEQKEGVKIEKIIITGGSGSLPGIVPYLSNKLNMNIYLGDPWARVVVPEPLRPVLDEIGPRFAVAVGLAMRDMES